MGDTRKIVGDQIRRLRDYAGLTQQQLGLMVGLSREQINRMENGTGNPSLNQLDKVLEGIGCPINKLFDEQSWTELGIIRGKPAIPQEEYRINYRIL